MRTVIEIKAEQPIKSVIVESSFSSYKKMARRVLARSWWTWWTQPLTYIVLSDSYSPEPIDRISPIPLLFIHGEEDSMVEPESSKEMFSAAHDPKQLWLVPNGHHGDLLRVNKSELHQKLLSYFQ